MHAICTHNKHTSYSKFCHIAICKATCIALASYSFKATKELYIETTVLTGSLALYMYLECSNLKLYHDNIIEVLMMALIATRGNSITI